MLSILWRDFWSCVSLVFLFLCLLLLLFVADPKPEEEQEAKAVGSMMVLIAWDADKDVDIDLWVRCPGSPPTGYSATHQRYCDLVRDDLGKYNDTTMINAEAVVSRGLPDGEFVLNVHSYRGVAAMFPVTVAMEVSVNDGSILRKVAASQIVLKAVGEERTVLRFRLKDGRIVAGSISNIFEPLRAARAGRP